MGCTVSPIRSTHAASRALAQRDLLLLSGADLRRAVSQSTAIDVLRETYARLAESRADQGRSLGFSVEGGSIHVKAGLLPGSHAAFAAKVNVNLPGNPERNGLPTIQGVVLLSDATDGRPLAVIESMTLTAMRTAAAATLAATYGARKDAAVIAIIGCGSQAPYQLDSFRAAFPLRQARVFDMDGRRAAAFAAQTTMPDCPCVAAASVAAAIEGADIVVTCTTSKAPILTEDMRLPGCFIAAMGADNPGKQEIAPGLMARARLLADDIEQCAQGGDLAHALRAGAVTLDDVRGDLADLASGKSSGRDRADELVIFDSTGSGVQDVALAWAAYNSAAARNIGSRFRLGD
ncbi:MAG: ornithine cyclodeaminase family protein [Pseudomonadota bacterium]|nr:ornithine cyclodeaminase family protein [Pseudomonadota bacterium]